VWLYDTAACAGDLAGELAEIVAESVDEEIRAYFRIESYDVADARLVNLNVSSFKV
jgi:hypothetical protein